MSEKLSNNKIDIFEARTSASKPYFNMIEADDPKINPEIRHNYPKSVFLATKTKDKEGKAKVYPLWEREFEILQVLCSTPLSGKEMAKMLSLRHQELRNYLRTIYKKFNIGNEVLHKSNTLIFKLLSEGILEFRPSIPDKDISLYPDA